VVALLTDGQAVEVFRRRLAARAAGWGGGRGHIQTLILLLSTIAPNPENWVETVDR
jgi:hypothetical protein